MLLLKLAFRNILRNRRRSLLTLLSMSGGYFLLATMISMSEGSYSHMINLFTQDHTGHVQIHYSDYLTRPSLNKTINNVDELVNNISGYPHVKSVTSRVYAPSLAYGKNKTFPAQVIGIDPKREAATTLLELKVKQGQWLSNGMSESGYFPALIGVSLATNLNLGLGDELILISQGIDGSIANDIFIITGIVGTADSYERNNVYLSLGAIKQFLAMHDQAHEVVIALDHQSRAMPFADALKLPQNLNAAPWQKIEESFYKSMQVDKKGNYISLGVIMFLVSIGVLNTVLMGTMERTREFGVLKAIGTRPKMVFMLIIMESFILALASCIVGMLLAFAPIYYLTYIGLVMPEPIDMGGVEFQIMLGEFSAFVLLVPAITVIGSTLLVSLFPALKAAKTVPVSAMQAA
ncbi:ABC transporter permease [Thalassotalea litorea]|uniref:ABC transporter permease n=1 Tax=Thalassotalea litorea TaxID=2020715 RepID=A0A5R9IQQ2_9GAMM|nr:ABC transporter permease [Thalassotalea litorea]TLU66377.1 ABC transporter permease [Thalassotalea litorea]